MKIFLSLISVVLLLFFFENGLRTFISGCEYSSYESNSTFTKNEASRCTLNVEYISDKGKFVEIDFFRTSPRIHAKEVLVEFLVKGGDGKAEITLIDGDGLPTSRVVEAHQTLSFTQKVKVVKSIANVAGFKIYIKPYRNFFFKHTRGIHIDMKY